MKLAFTKEERGDMRTFVEKMDPVVAVFQQRFEEIFKQLATRDKTPALWVQYHHMTDVIKVFIRTERLADHNGYLSCHALLPRYLTSMPREYSCTVGT